MGVIVGCISQKGGVGKSTLSRALARESAAGGMKVKLADLDTQQGTCVSWQVRRNKAGVIPEISVESYPSVRRAIEGGQGFDMLILDGPARASVGTLEIAKAADLLVQPTAPSLDDLEPAVLLFHELVQKGIAPDKLVFAISRLVAESQEGLLRQYLQKTPYFTLQGYIPERLSYVQAMNGGRTITETPFKKLNKRSDQLLQALIDRIVKISGA